MAHSITIRPVRSRRDLKAFIDFQYDLYREVPAWIAPLRHNVHRILNPKKNAFFQHGSIFPMLALDRDGKLVGRIAAIVNGMHLKKHDDGNGFFGFFDTVEDYGVARALLDAVSKHLTGQGLAGMRGPVNPSMNDTAGLLVKGFDREPSVLMPYNAPYYEDFLERYGFRRAMTMWAYYIHDKYIRIEKLERGVRMLQKRHPGVSLRTIDMSRFYEEARTILHIYNDAWSKNWGHAPMMEEEFIQLADDMKRIVDPNLVFILEDEGKPVAFSVSIPNVNQLLRHVNDGRLLPFGLLQMTLRARFGGIHECRTPLLGVLPEYQSRGLDAMLILATIREGRKRGWVGSELSWVLDSNMKVRNAFQSFGAVLNKEYAMFEKRLAE